MKKIDKLSVSLLAGVALFVCGCRKGDLIEQSKEYKVPKIIIPEVSFEQLVELANQADEVSPGFFRTMRVLGEDRIEISVGNSVKPMSGGGQLIQFVKRSGKWEVADVDAMDF